ncbi:hypothetical protein [Burkholderia pseudomallei]|uniref:hypothetical protein n=1 Tax=Burkholderia pseudomallei TaxID=28450 RepID=UPI0034DE032B
MTTDVNNFDPRFTVTLAAAAWAAAWAAARAAARNAARNAAGAAARDAQKEMFERMCLGTAPWQQAKVAA